MKLEKLNTAKRLATMHMRIDQDVKGVYLIEAEDLEEDLPQEPIKLLEVVEGTPEVGIEPIGFPSDPGRGIAYTSVIVEISPAEFHNFGGERIRFGERPWRVTGRLTEVNGA